MAPGSPSSGSGSYRTLQREDIGAFVRDELLAVDRELPVVAITTSNATGRPWVNPAEAARLLEGHAQVVVIRTGEATFELSDALPKYLNVYGGATRIWWPGLDERSDYRDHPLLFARSATDGDRALRRLVAEIRPADLDELLPSPWRRVAEVYDVGDVVRGRVVELVAGGALVELLPGAAGLVHLGELDWSYVTDPADFVHPGDLVAVRILSMDADRGRAELSLKRAHGEPVRHAIAAEPDGEPFLAAGFEHLEAASPGAAVADASSAQTGADTGTDSRADDLQAEVDALLDERSRLRGRLREAEKELRSARDRIDNLQRVTAFETDPTSSGTAFLLAVRLAYARMVSEAERHERPLLRMRVGREFLERLRALDGVPLEKVIEVCAQVACGWAHEIPAREVHRFHAGKGGAPVAVRASDGAKAWRCSLQDNTPSARRLHWWSARHDDGSTVIEFASVGLHDAESMPE